MRSMQSSFFAVAAALCVTANLPAATVQSILDKARHAAGEESTLNSVKSLRYAYKVLDKDGKELGLNTMEYKAPLGQRETDTTKRDADGAKLEVTVAIDGREGYRLIRRPDNGGRRLIIMPSAEVNIRRDSVRENLTFFTVPAADRCEVKVGPDETIDGTACDTLEYHYKTGQLLRQYIAKDSGRYAGYRLGSQADRGLLVVNKTETKTSGIAVPDTIEIRDDKNAVLATLKMAKFELNPEIPDSAFTTPLY